MTFHARAARPGAVQRLDILCVPEGEAHRIYVWPDWMPEYLAASLDEHGEAYPVYLDFDELDRYLAAEGVQCVKLVAADGSVEIEAKGPAATVLTMWLSRMFQSGAQGVLS